MSAFDAIDLSLLPPPGVVEDVDFETLLAAAKTGLEERDPSLAAVMQLESEPLVKQLEIAAYREMLVRERINSAARGVMLAFAAGADLDQIAANYSVARLVLDPGNPAAFPPVPPTLEADEDLRRRVQIAPEAFTSAGSRGAYVFHALSADGDVKDAEATSPLPGEVTVHVLSRQGDGTAGPDLRAAVDKVLSADTVRPLTDSVTVVSAEITPYAVEAELTVEQGPDAEVVRQQAQAAAEALVAAQHRLGRSIRRSALFASLHQPGVAAVVLASPAADIVMGPGEAAYATAVTVTLAGAGT